MRRRRSFVFSFLFGCGAMLALVACSSGGGVGQNELDAERARAEAAEKTLEAAEETLDDLRRSLQRAQEALASGGSAAQRTSARTAVSAARRNLEEVRQTLAAQPDDAAKAAAGEALAAADTALERVDEALAAAGAMTAGSGPVVLATMHTTLDRAQTALDDAQTKLGEALDENPSGTLRTLLAQTQATLVAAQVSLVPLLREELATAERDAAAQRTRADTEKARADGEKARADAEKARADAEKTRADTADAELDRMTLSFGEDLKIGGPEASRLAPADDSAVALSPRRAGVMLTANTGFDPTGPWRDATRYAVADYGTANPDRLPIASDPVAWRDGSAMVIPGESGSPATDEFPGRGEVFRGESYDRPEFLLARQGSYGPASDGTAAAAIPRLRVGTGLRANLRGHAVWSFQYRDEGGLTMKFGGLPPDEKPEGATDASMGSLIFGDLERLAAKGTYSCGATEPMTMACDETVTGDLTVSFGAPSRDPAGEPNYYWTVDVPNPKLALEIGETVDVDEAEPAAPDDNIGRYEMVLSNHAGDDSDVYLRYAAYGLFQFIDYQTQSQRPGRMQTFHYGFDAFGSHNPLPASTADSIAATWKGRTTAWLATTRANSHFVGGLDRMRGNVTLHACIGGGGCGTDAFVAPAGAAKPTDANDIVGAIHDLEILLPGGAWGSGDTTGHPRGGGAFLGDILLDGAIDANGAFSGTAMPDPELSDSQRSAGDSGARTDGPDTHGYTIRPQIGGDARAMTRYWRNGRFEGAIYGPRDALEAAGTWWLPASASDVDNNVLGIIGSFGAVSD